MGDRPNRLGLSPMEWACRSIIFYRQEKVICDIREEEVHCNEG